MADAQTPLVTLSSTGGTTAVVADVLGFPASGTFKILIGSEILTVTSGQGTTTWTVTRASDGTTAAVHAPGSTVTYVPEAYATLDQLLASMNVPPTSTAVYPYLLDLLNQAADRIDQECRRQFYRSPRVSGDAVTYIDVDEWGCLVKPPDIISITTLEMATYTGGTYTTIPQGSTGYYLRQPPGSTSDWPYALSLSDRATTYRSFYPGRETVKVTGATGWSAIPSVIQKANVDFAREQYRLGRGGGTPLAGNTMTGSPIWIGMPEWIRRSIELYRKRDFSWVAGRG